MIYPVDNAIRVHPPFENRDLIVKFMFCILIKPHEFTHCIFKLTRRSGSVNSGMIGDSTWDKDAIFDATS